MMKKWAISWINWYDNTLNMAMCIAETETEALLRALKENMNPITDEDWEEFKNDLADASPEEIKQEAFNQDGMVGALLL